MTLESRITALAQRIAGAVGKEVDWATRLNTGLVAPTSVGIASETASGITQLATAAEAAAGTASNRGLSPLRALDFLGGAAAASTLALVLGQRRGTDAARLALSGGALFDGLRFFATDTKWTWIYSTALGKWRPWDSPWIAFTSQYRNWSFGAGSSQSNRYRWDAGHVEFESYLQAASGTTNTDRLIISVPEPIKFDYNTVKSPTIPGSTVHIYDTGSGIDFYGAVRPNREFDTGAGGIGGPNPTSIAPLAMRVDGGFGYLVGIGGNTPFVSGGIPANSQVWAACRYESNNYPFS